MPIELRVPAVGESIAEVQIGAWLKQEGQSVRKDETLVQIESEKATVDLPSPADGVLTRILKARGGVARVGEAIAHLETGALAALPVASAPTAGVPETALAAPPGSAPTGGPAAAVLPAAQRVLAEAGLSATAVAGTGPGGRVTKEDALKAAQAVATSPPAAVSATPVVAVDPAAAAAASSPIVRSEEIVPMSPLRRTVARRLVEAQSTMALLTTFNEIDMSAVMALRKQYQDAFTARHGVKLGFMSFFVKAVVEALKQFPQLNAEVRDQSIVYHHTYDIGVAIGGGKGLVVPVVRQADRLAFAEIEKAIADFGARAKDARIKPDELQGGTFTITNGGIYGSLLSTPIVNPPQSGILGMHAIQDRPVVVDGQIAVRPMMYVALTYDHRIVDGREAVSFLRRVKDVIEAPARMLLEA